MNKKKILSFIFIYLFYFTNSYSIEPDIFVQSTVNRASKVLSDNTLSKDKKIMELQNIAKETVDIRGIGLYTLGSARKGLSDEQKSEYSKLFNQYFYRLQKSY